MRLDRVAEGIPPMADEEPVGYLGGAQPSEAPSSTANDNPYGAPAEDEEVVGYLGGQEELPALPPAQGENYSASDFMGAGGGYDDPYGQDPYGQEASAQDAYADPYSMPAEGGYGEYEGYDTAAMGDGDPSYYDSMGHEPEYDTGSKTEPVGYATEEFEDDDQPKTISQQDAESIIRRITTKRILPPEQAQAGGGLAPPRLTAADQAGLRIAPILAGALLLTCGMVYMFRIPLAERMPWFADMIGYVKPVDNEAEVKEVEDPNKVAEKRFLDLVLLSETKAFNAKPEDVKPLGSAAKTGAKK